MINLSIRLKQKWFWLTLVPLVFLFVDQVVQLISLIQVMIETGQPLYESELMTLAMAIIGVAFSILALIGFPVDLTTDGYGDSVRALNYDTPAHNASETAMLYEGMSMPIKMDTMVNEEEYADLVKRSCEQDEKIGGTE